MQRDGQAGVGAAVQNVLKTAIMKPAVFMVAVGHPGERERWLEAVSQPRRERRAPIP